MTTWAPRNTTRARELRNAATPAERELWRYLSRSQLGAKFSRQMPAGPFYADFLCRSHGLVIELDGFSHDLRRAGDDARDVYMRQHGFTVLRFANEDVFASLEGVIMTIRQALAAMPTPGPSRRREGGI